MFFVNEIPKTVTIENNTKPKPNPLVTPFNIGELIYLVKILDSKVLYKTKDITK